MSEEEGDVAGENTSDSTKREAYLEALRAKIAVESAKSAMDKKTAEYRGVLKKYKKLGVNTDAVTYALAVRMEDPDEVFIRERERLRLLDLSGFLPDIKDRLTERLDVEEATSHEDNQLALAKAYDLGSKTGRSGITRDANPYLPGTQLFVEWVSGWMAGQRAIADEMERGAIGDGTPIQPPPKGKAGRPPGAKNKLKPLRDDTAAAVADLAEDEGETIPMFGDEEPVE